VGPGLEIKPYIVYSDLGVDENGLVNAQEDRQVARHVYMYGRMHACILLWTGGG
jgi:hypothetical protein